eukprot:Rhum_TRINITY_DN18726_c0_g1::Rhum_TRINITY_DN18726_c0_g1_i1::g.168134::m.168134
MPSTPLLLLVAAAAAAASAAATRPCPAGWDEALSAGSMRCVRVSAGDARGWDVAAGDCPLAVFETRAELDAAGASALLAEGEAYWVGAQLDATLQGFATGPRWLPRGSRAVEGGARVPAFPGGEHLLSLRDDHVLIDPPAAGQADPAVLCASIVRNATLLPRGYSVVFAPCDRALRALCTADSFELAVANDDAAGRVLAAPETVDVPRLDEAGGVFFVLGAAAPEDEAAPEEGSAVELGDVTHTAAAPNATGERAGPLLQSAVLTVWVVEAPPPTPTAAAAAAPETESPAGTEAPGSSPEEAVAAPFLPYLNVTWDRTAFEVASVDLSRAHDYFVRRTEDDFVEVWIDGVLVKKAAWLPGRTRGGFGSITKPTPAVTQPTHGAPAPVVVMPGPASVANLTFFDRSTANFTAATVAALTVSSTERTSAPNTNGLVLEQTVGECHSQLIGNGQAGFVLRPFAEASSHARCKARCLQDPLCDGYALALVSATCWLFVADEGGSEPAASRSAASSSPSGLAEPARCGRRVRATVGSMRGTAHVDVPVANASSDAAACAAYGLEPLRPTVCRRSAFHASTAAGECMSASGGHVRCQTPWPRQLTGAGCGAFEKPSDLGPPEESASWTPLAACPRELWWVSYRLQFKAGPSKVAAVTVVAPPGQARQVYGVYACVSQYDTDYWRHNAEAESDEERPALYHNVARDLRCLLIVECETAPVTDPQSAVRYQKTTCPMNVYASIIRVHVKSVGSNATSEGDEELLPSIRNLEIEATESGVPPGTPAPPPEITFESTDAAAKVLSAILAVLSTLMFSCGLFSHAHKLKLCRPSAIHTEEGPVIPAGVEQSHHFPSRELVQVPQAPHEVGGSAARMVAVRGDDADGGALPHGRGSRVVTKDLVADAAASQPRWHGPGAAPTLSPTADKPPPDRTAQSSGGAGVSPQERALGESNRSFSNGRSVNSRSLESSRASPTQRRRASSVRVNCGDSLNNSIQVASRPSLLSSKSESQGVGDESAAANTVGTASATKGVSDHAVLASSETTGGSREPPSPPV